MHAVDGPRKPARCKTQSITPYTTCYVTNPKPFFRGNFRKVPPDNMQIDVRRGAAAFRLRTRFATLRLYRCYRKATICEIVKFTSENSLDIADRHTSNIQCLHCQAIKRLAVGDADFIHISLTKRLLTR